MSTVKLSDIVCKYEDSSSGDFSEWLDKLELVAKLQKIDDLTSFLPLFLVGPAFAVYKQLAEATRNDYTELKKALLSAFGVNCYAAYNQLQRRVLQDGEGVDIYLADLRRLVTLMGQKDPEPLLKCAFMSGLPDDVSVQLKSMAAVEELSLEQLATRARMILSTRQSDTACAAGYRKQRGCYTCGSQAHFARECSKSANNKPTREPRRCYVCGDRNHIARNCTSNNAGKGQGGALAPDASPAQQ